MTDRVLLGRRNNGTYGLDISPVGSSVTSAAVKDMLFSTDWASASLVHATGTLARGQTAFFPTLPYAPIAFASIYHTYSGWNNAYWQEMIPNNGYGDHYELMTYGAQWDVGPNFITMRHNSAFDAYASNYLIRWSVLAIRGGA